MFLPLFLFLHLFLCGFIIGDLFGVGVICGACCGEPFGEEGFALVDFGDEGFKRDECGFLRVVHFLRNFLFGGGGKYIGAVEEGELKLNVVVALKGISALGEELAELGGGVDWIAEAGHMVVCLFSLLFVVACVEMEKGNVREIVVVGFIGEMIAVVKGALKSGVEDE